MAIYSGPRAVNEGLVLHLDASNPRSYVSGSAVWNDISGQNNNATRYGVPILEMDGTTQCFNFSTATGGFSYAASMGFTFSSNMIPTTGNFTLSCWVKNPNTSSGQVGLFSNAGGTDGYRFGVGTDGIYYLIGPDYQEGNVSFSSASSAALWYNVTAVYSRTSAKILLYRNGVYQSQASVSAAQTAFASTAPGIVRSNCCGLYTGKLAIFSAFHGALTENQILDNYDAVKGRFGY
jgi:hypothetical protein